MNMSSMPPDFWALSVIDQPQDRHVHCQPSAWDFCNRHDYRYLHGCLFLFPIISNFYWLTVVPDVGGWLNHLWVCGIIDCTCFDLSRSMLRLALTLLMRARKFCNFIVTAIFSAQFAISQFLAIPVIRSITKTVPGVSLVRGTVLLVLGLYLLSNADSPQLSSTYLSRSLTSFREREIRNCILLT